MQVFLWCSNEEEELWVWNYNGTDMFMDLEEDVSYSSFSSFEVMSVKC
jgi:hypothetical protein